MERVRIFDTTLRDGEQSPGCSMHLSEKLEVAHRLERLGVDVIEAGFAASSPGDFEAVEAIARMVKGCRVASLCRTTRGDIDAACGALQGAASPLVHTFIATSDLHLEYKLRMTREEVLAHIGEAVRYARSRIPEVECSFEDATRSDRAFLAQCCRQAVTAGAAIINIPDTVGYAMPGEMEELIAYLLRAVPELAGVTLSVHCHDDLGLAVANSLAGVRAGVRQVECTVNGIGERAGNASLEEVVMALATRPGYYGVETGINTRQIARASRTLSRIIGVPIPPNKAIVGANAFAHEAGIHQHGMLANRGTYEIMTPESVGISENHMVLGKHSGRHGFEEKLVALGYNLGPDAVDEVFDTFKQLCDKKKEVTDADIEALVDALSGEVPEAYALVSFVINSGNTIASTSTVKLDHGGAYLEEVAKGDGPINASFSAINRMVDLPVELDHYSIRSVSEGGDALGEVTVKVVCEGQRVTGRGLSTDILESSIRAYLNAINKLAYQREHGHAD